MGKGSQHWWHNEKVKQMKKNNPEKYQEQLNKERDNRYAKKAEKEKRQEQLKAEEALEEQRIASMSPDERNALLVSDYIARLKKAIPQIGEDNIDLGQEFSNAELRDFASKSFDIYGPSLFKLLCAAEIGANYSPGAVMIRNMVNDISRALGNRIFAVQIIRYHIAAEMQCFIRADAENDPRVITALKAVSGLPYVPLMGDVRFDAAYTLWSHTGSWLGAMKLAGLNLISANSERIKVIDRYKAKKASPELLPDSARKRLNDKTMNILKLICNTANNAERLIYDYEMPSGAAKIIKTSGYSTWQLLSHVGLTQPTEKATPEIRAEIEARRRKNSKAKDPVQSWQADNSKN